MTAGYRNAEDRAFTFAQSGILGRGQQLQQRVTGICGSIGGILGDRLDGGLPGGENIVPGIVRLTVRRFSRVAGDNPCIQVAVSIQQSAVPVEPEDIVGHGLPVGHVGSVDKVRFSSKFLIPLDSYIQLWCGESDHFLFTCPANKNVILAPGVDQGEAIDVRKVDLGIVRQHHVSAITITIGDVGDGAEIHLGLIFRPNRKQLNVRCLNLDLGTWDIPGCRAVLIR